MTTIAEYRQRWEDFAIDCDNLHSVRRHFRHVLTNQGIDWDEACAEADAFEARIAPLPVSQRVTEIECAAYRYEDM